MDTPPTAPSAASLPGSGRPAAVLRLVVLLALVAWTFAPELRAFARVSATGLDWCHALAAPLLIATLIWLRRDVLGAALGRGSYWGVLLLAAGYALYGLCLWPFQYAYPRDAALVIVLAGAVAAAAGWRTLWRCAPLLLLVALAIPVGSRFYAAMIIRPETWTLSAARLVLDQLPGVSARLDGPDLELTRAGIASTVALGEPHRGAALFAAYATIGVFVTFARVRPAWQLLLLSVLAVPLVLLCNLLRVVGWGIITTYVRPDPVDGWARVAAAASSLVAAYALFGLACGISSCLVVEVRDDEDGWDTAEQDGV